MILALLALAACKDKPASTDTIDVAKAMPNLPLPPDAQFVSKSGSPDAVQLVFQSRATPALVEDFYRDVFTAEPWRLVGDSKDATGTTVLYAEQNGPPMWVRIAPSGRGARVEIAGADPTADTSFVRRSRGARDSANALRPLKR
ncbi:MAG: hypothetical protein H0U85_01385 [Gemmatimonadales bacterium]|nr:hypothetical protein [Gemmatimonadales bacterium]